MTPNNISEAFAESAKEAIDGTVDMLLSTVEEIGWVRCFRTRGMEPLGPPPFYLNRSGAADILMIPLPERVQKIGGLADIPEPEPSPLTVDYERGRA